MFAFRAFLCPWGEAQFAQTTKSAWVSFRRTFWGCRAPTYFVAAGPLKFTCLRMLLEWKGVGYLVGMPAASFWWFLSWPVIWAVLAILIYFKMSAEERFERDE